MIIASWTQFHLRDSGVNAFSVITNLRMELFEALWATLPAPLSGGRHETGESPQLQLHSARLATLASAKWKLGNFSFTPLLRGQGGRLCLIAGK